MSNIIKIKRGLKANLPTLEVGEMGYCTDTNELFIGTSTGNELINEADAINELADIGDVSVSNLQDGDILVYIDGEWVNQNQFPPAKEFGIQWDQPNDTVTRLGDGVGLTAGSDFTALGDDGVWNLRRCMVNDDLSINYYIDPTDPTKIGEVVNTGDYTTGGTANYTGSHGQVMVEIPKFYWKYEEPSSNVYQWWVSPKEASGDYEVHPAFITGSTTKDFIYMSAFEGTVDTNNLSTGKLRSISGVQPSTDTNVSGGTINNFRSYAQARGTGWQMQTYWGTHALQVLYSVEYANFDSQTTIGQGIVNKGGVGNQSENTGATISLGNTSGAASGTDGLVSISYRGVENFWGNIWKWVDGINRNGSEVFVANENFASDVFSGSYTLLTNNILSGLQDFPTNITFPHFFMSVGGGSSTSHLYDVNDFRNTGNRVARFGGGWDFALNSGVFIWRLSDSSSDNNRRYGSRLQIL